MCPHVLNSITRCVRSVGERSGPGSPEDARGPVRCPFVQDHRPRPGSRCRSLAIRRNRVKEIVPEGPCAGATVDRRCHGTKPLRFVSFLLAIGELRVYMISNNRYPWMQPTIWLKSIPASRSGSPGSYITTFGAGLISFRISAYCSIPYRPLASASNTKIVSSVTRLGFARRSGSGSRLREGRRSTWDGSRYQQAAGNWQLAESDKHDGKS